jgi:peptidoglycan/xylan/chitin deacetylase (PgdA/CDA1 family)
MRIPALGRLKQGVRRLRNTLAPGSLILMYHRIAEVECDPWSLCVTPSHFAEHLEVLRQSTQPVPLRYLNQTLQEGQRLPKAVALTFDDGYADNLHQAKPLLERFGIPATIFVASGYTDQAREFWWDRLESLLLHPGYLPETLTLKIGDRSYSWDLGTDAAYSETQYQRDRGWKAEQPQPPTLRHALYRSLHKLLQPLSEAERAEVMSELVAWSGAETPSRPSFYPLTLAELSALERGEFIEIGSHTVTHPLLSSLPLNLQYAEIQASKASLEERLGHEIRSFAYPYGNYTPQTVALVQEAGYTCACSTLQASVRPGSDRFQLPRLEVQDWDGDLFAQKLRQWFKNA